jgi:hypothetical protein
MDIIIFKAKKIIEIIRNVEIIRFNATKLQIIHTYYDKTVIQYTESVFEAHEFDNFEVRKE